MRRRTLNRMRDRLLLFLSTGEELWRQLENMQIVIKGMPNKTWINTRCEFMWIKSEYNNQKGMFAPPPSSPHNLQNFLSRSSTLLLTTCLRAQSGRAGTGGHAAAASRVFQRSAQTCTQQTARRDIESKPNPYYAVPDCDLERAVDLGIEKCADKPQWTARF